MIDSELNYQNCTSCGIPRTLDYMNGKGVCEFCKPMEPIYEDLLECSDCGAEFYASVSQHEFTCSDCANNPYL